MIDKPVADAVKTACPECPFNRLCEPGKLGGSPIEIYVGQIAGPFVLACHMHVDFDNPNWKQSETYTQTPQCAGAAIFRANLGLDRIMPDAIPKLPADREKVFANFQEFVDHHAPESTPAKLRLANSGIFIRTCRDRELARQEVVLVKGEKHDGK